MSMDASAAVVAKHIARHKVRKPVNPLDKKIPENPKYKNVKPTIDTGASMTKYLNKIEEIKTNYKFRKDEIFKRMKISTFVQLVVQVHRLSQPDPTDMYVDSVSTSQMDEGGDRNLLSGNSAHDNDDLIEEWPGSVRSEISEGSQYTPSQGGPYNPNQGGHYASNQGGRQYAPSLILSEGDYGDTRSNAEPESSRSTLLSVARGIGEMDLRGQKMEPVIEQKPTENLACPYLLLDIRDKDEYDQCHIIPALSYSKAYLSRSVNYESREMLQFKNRQGKIIVVYDEDEKIAPIAAATLVQRGYDNIFMLSGGLKVASKVFPEGLITGTLPISISGVKPKQLCMASQNQLSDENINRLEMYLDRVLQESTNGRPGSTASVASSRISRTGSAISKASSTISDRPAFRP